MVVVLLVGCKEVAENRQISKALDDVLADYTTRYNKDNVIILNFYKIEDQTLFSIGHSRFYFNKEMNGCFIYNKKLVVYYLYSKDSLADSLIDYSFTADRDILKDYIFFGDMNCEYDGKPNIEDYVVKSKECIVKAKEADLKYKEIVSDTTGIKSDSFNKLINERFNHSNACITAIRFASFENDCYIHVKDVDSYSRKNLNGCLKRNGRIVTFYNTENLLYPNMLDQQLIQQSLSLLNKYKEFSDNEFMFRLVAGDVYKISSNGSVIKVDMSEWTDDKCNMLYHQFGL